MSTPIFPEDAPVHKLSPDEKKIRQKFKGGLNETQLKAVHSILCKGSTRIGRVAVQEAKKAIYDLNTNETTLALEALFIAVHECTPIRAKTILGKVKKVVEETLPLEGNKFITPEELESRIYGEIKAIDPAHAKAVQKRYLEVRKQLENAPEKAAFLIQIYKHFGKEGFQQLSSQEKEALIQGKSLTLQEQQAIIKKCNQGMIELFETLYPTKVFSKALKELPEEIKEGKKAFSKQEQQAFTTRANRILFEVKGIHKDALEKLPEEFREVISGGTAITETMEAKLQDISQHIQQKNRVETQKIQEKLHVLGSSLPEIFSPQERELINTGAVSLREPVYAMRLSQALFTQLVNDSKPFTPEKIRQLKDLAESLPKEAHSEDFSKLTKMLYGTLMALEMSLNPLIVDQERLGPEKTGEGMSGSYFLRGFEETAESWAGISFIYSVFKPTLEEAYAPENPHAGQSKEFFKAGKANLDILNLRALLGTRGLRNGNPSGEASKKEHVAYLLDHDHFAGVPLTVMVELPYHPIFVKGSAPTKGGSLQEFQSETELLKPLTQKADCDTLLPGDQLRRMAILDIRYGNSDRHFENFLFRQKFSGERTLIPIDHGLTFPDSFDEARFGWAIFNACKKPFGPEERDYVANLDIEKDVAILRAHGIREACIPPFIARTTLLKKGVQSGLTAGELSLLMEQPASGTCPFAEACLRADPSHPQFVERLESELEALIQTVLKARK